MQAIETEWKGYRFRSRLEARWAVFFEQLDLSWNYEPQGFILGTGKRYLPDFKVETPYPFDYWYEVKHEGVKEDDKFDEFEESVNYKIGSDGDHRKVAKMLSGDPYTVLCESSYLICPSCGGIQGDFWDNPPKNQFWDDRICHPCDAHTPTGSGNDEMSGEISPFLPRKGVIKLDDYGAGHREIFNMKVSRAAKGARQARFEHGESPSI